MVHAGDAIARLSMPIWVKGEVPRAIKLARDAVDILEREPPGPELAFAYASLAGRLGIAGDPEGSAPFADRAIALAGELGLPHIRQRALQTRGGNRCELGDLGGVEDLREAVRLGLELGLGPMLSRAYINLSFWVWLTEGPAPSLALHREAIEFEQRRGLGGESWPTGELCWFLYDGGDWDELLTTATKVRGWDRGLVDENWQPGLMALSMSALVHAHRGSIAEAVSVEEEILSRARELRDPQVIITALATAAVIEGYRGGDEAAAGLAAELAETARDLSPSWRAHRLSELARACVSAGALDVMRELLDGLEVVAARDRNSALTAEALLAEAKGDLKRALDLHTQAAERWREFGHVPETVFALLGAGRCLVRLGRAAEAASALREARDIFTRLGAAPSVAEADELLAQATARSS